MPKKTPIFKNKKNYEHLKFLRNLGSSTISQICLVKFPTFQLSKLIEIKPLIRICSNLFYLIEETKVLKVKMCWITNIHHL